MPAQTARTPGNGSGTLTYTLTSDSFDVEAVYVSVDNTAGASAVTAELTIKDQSGVVIARKKQAGTIAAGATGSATWALRLDDESAAGTGGTGIQFDVDNEGGWLEVGSGNSIPAGDLAPSGIGFKDTNSGGGIGLWDGNLGAGVTVMTGDKNAMGWSFGGGGINLWSQNGNVNVISVGLVAISATTNTTISTVNDVHLTPDSGVTGVGFLVVDNLPTVNPGGTGRVWNDLGTLKIT